MRKIFVGLLSAVCLICLGLAAACKNKEPQYFTLIYADQAGITYDFGEIKSGAEVKSGYTVTFTVSYDERLEGEPVVMANESELKADANGAYSFVMREDVSVSVLGVYMPDDYSVIFDSGDAETGAAYRIWFYDENGKDVTDAELTYGGGEKVSFTLQVSVYYGDSQYRVSANSLILEPDNDGVYSFNVLDDTRISVENLEQDLGFTEREDGGAGTADDPYRIVKPIDLYYMADLVGDSYYNGRFAMSYYRLEADIDMNGEQLYIIGDRPTDDSISMFCGDFDGNGHTISNYYIEDSIIEQSGFTEVPLRYIGLFGYVNALASDDVSIYDLTLDNFKIEINGAKHLALKTGFYAGGLVGYGVGVNITNCKVNGTIVADGNTDYPAHVGGVIGYMQAAYSANAYYVSGVTGSEANVEIECALGYVYSAGGVVGYMSASNKVANAFVLNSYSTGSVSGALHTGGVVGYMGPYSSVINCYSTGTDVYARSDNSVINGIDRYSYAYAGGIAGYASYGTVIADSFSTCEYIGANSVLGSAYEKTNGIIAGNEGAGETYVNSYALIILNSYSADSKVTLNSEFCKNTLGWNTSDWDFTGAYPVAKGGSDNVSVKITIKDGNGTVSVFNADAYELISHWYSNGLDEFITSGNDRSYGYFFDAAKTQPVTTAYIPTHDIDIYVDFTDYSEVAGTYYLRTGNGDVAYFALRADGTFTYRYGALSYENLYVYDGNSVILLENPAFMETLSDGTNSVDYYICGKADIGADNSILSFYDGVNYTQSAPLLGVKEFVGFNYGEYYADGVDDYTFYKDGTGVNGRNTFTYTVKDGKITINLSTGSVATGTVSGNTINLGGVTYNAYDEFKGTWEQSATVHKQYTFDGKGNWTYAYFGYDEEGNKQPIEDQASGTYEKRDNSIVLSNGTVVGYDAVNKWLTIEDTPFYKENSLVGEWKFLYVIEDVTVNFYGIGADGYGKAQITYGPNVLTLEADYELVQNGNELYVLIVVDDSVYGSLTYSAQSSTLTGYMFLATLGRETNNALFCLFDDFKGVWISELGLVEFNGLGMHKYNGTATYSRVEGSVSIDGKKVGTYTVDGTMINGSFTYNSVEYTIHYNVETGDITAETDVKQFEMIEVDEMYSIDLVSEDGTLYTFNGGGRLTTGGTLTVKGSETNTYVYYVTNDGVEIEELGTLVNDNGVYKLNTSDGGQTILSVDNPFTGSWIKGGVITGDVVIGKINADMTATGSYLGTNVTFRYNAEGVYLTFDYEGTDLYVIALKSVGNQELAISTQPDTYASFDVCIVAAELDEYVGVYAGDESTLTLDGFSSCEHTSGTAVLKDADGKVTQVYSYSINVNGEIELKADTRYVFAVTDKTDGVFTAHGKNYEIIAVDYFYLRNAVDAAGIVYRFNGHGTVTATNGMVFEYVIEEYDGVLYEYTLTFTAGDKSYTAIYDLAAVDYSLTVTPDYLEGKTATDENGTAYTFDGKGAVTATGNKKYEYTVDAYNANRNEYSLTLVLTVEKENADPVKVEYDAVYSCDDNKITVTLKDVFESVRAKDADGNTYTFDGNGKVSGPENKTYDYEIVSYNEANDAYTFKFTAGDEEYTAVYSRGNATLTLTSD